MPKERIEAELREKLRQLAALCSTHNNILVRDSGECLVLDVAVPWAHLAEFTDVLKAVVLIRAAKD